MSYDINETVRKAWEVAERVLEGDRTVTDDQAGFAWSLIELVWNTDGAPFVPDKREDIVQASNGDDELRKILSDLSLEHYPELIADEGEE